MNKLSYYGAIDQNIRKFRQVSHALSFLCMKTTFPHCKMKSLSARKCVKLAKSLGWDPKKYHVGQDDCLHDVLRKQNVQATDANVIMLLKYNSNVLEYGQLIPGMELTIPAVWNKEQIK